MDVPAEEAVFCMEFLISGVGNTRAGTKVKRQQLFQGEKPC